MSNNRINVSVDGVDDVLKMLEEVDHNTYFKVTDKGIRKASQLVQRRAKQLAPRSSKTGSAKKRSVSQSQSGNWNIPLSKTIISKVLKHARGALGIVGPSWPEGNKAFFNNAKNGRREVYWGKPQGTIYKGEDWLKRAFDESAEEAQEVLVETVRDAVKEVTGG